MALAQVGEFSFLLASVGGEAGLLPGNDYQLFIAASVLTMMATPVFIAAARPLADGLSSRLGLAVPSVPLSESEGLAELRDSRHHRRVRAQRKAPGSSAPREPAWPTWRSSKTVRW